MATATPPCTPDIVRERLAETYRAAALAGADMRTMADRLERLREACTTTADAYDAWELFDDCVADAYGRPEAQAVVDLRRQYGQDVATSALATMQAAPAAEAWQVFATCVAETVLATRFELALTLAGAPVALGDREADRRVLQDGIRRALHERWAETSPMFRLLSELVFLSARQRARLIAVQGQIEMYHLFRNDRAKALIDRGLEIAPEDPHVTTALGEYFLNRNDVLAARSWFERALAIAPRLTWAAYQLGDCALRENDLASAEAWYRETLKRRPSETGALTRLCRLEAKRLQRSEPDPIPELRARAAAIDPPGQYSFLIEIGAVYQEIRQLEAAHAHYHGALALDPLRLGAYTAEGYLALEEEKLPDARRHFQRAIEVAPEALDGYWGMARLAEQEGNWAEAEQMYAESLPRRQEWKAIIKATIARLQSRQARWTEAEQSALEAIRLDPTDETVLSIVEGVADDIARTPDIPRARRLYDAVRLAIGDPYEARYRNQIGNMLTAAGDHAAASEAFRQAVEADRTKALYSTSLARSLRERRAWEESRDLWDQTLPDVRLDSAFRAEMALLRNAEANEFFTKGAYASAIPLYEEAIAYTPADAILLSNLANAWEQDRSEPIERRLDQIEAALKEAIRLTPKPAEYERRLAEAQRLRNLLPAFGDIDLDRLPIVTPIALEIANELVPFVQGDAEGGLSPDCLRLITATRTRLREKYGVAIPGIRIRGSGTDGANYLVILDEVPAVLGAASTDKRFSPSTVASLGASGIEADPGSHPARNTGSWVSRENWERALAKGHVLWEVMEYVLRHIEFLVERNLGDFIGVQEAGQLLDSISASQRDAVRSSSGGLPRFVAVLRGLLSERVPLGNFPALCDAFVALDSKGLGPSAIVEELRASELLKPLLPGNAHGVRTISFDAAFEERFARALHVEGASIALAMPVEDVQATLVDVRERVDDASATAFVVENARIRPFLRKVTEMEWPDVPVLARREVVTAPANAGAGVITNKEVRADVRV